MFRYSAARALFGPSVKPFITDFGNDQGFARPRLHEEAIRANAAGFAAETRSLFGALGQRIKRENTELYPLLEKLSRP